MRSFTEFEKLAATHHGSLKTVREKAANPYLDSQLSNLPDDRILSNIAERIFTGGFAWKVIHAKWPDFEEAFEGFDPHKLCLFRDEMI